jgi:hypothetical protein
MKVIPETCRVHYLSWYCVSRLDSFYYKYLLPNKDFYYIIWFFKFFFWAYMMKIISEKRRVQ